MKHESEKYKYLLIAPRSMECLRNSKSIISLKLGFRQIYRSYVYPHIVERTRKEHFISFTDH